MGKKKEGIKKFKMSIKNFNSLKLKENLKPIKFELAKLFIESRQKVAGIGCMATKAGMTTWFLPTGEAIACTVVVFEGGNKVTMIKKKNPMVTMPSKLDINLQKI